MVVTTVLKCLSQFEKLAHEIQHYPSIQQSDNRQNSACRQQPFFECVQDFLIVTGVEKSRRGRVKNQTRATLPRHCKR